MELAIKVPDDFYERVNKDGCMSYTDAEVVVNAFYLGKVLPKRHGDLKDVGNIHLDKFIRIENFSLNPRFSEEYKKGYNSAIDDALYVLMSAPVLIEADKEGANE